MNAPHASNAIESPRRGMQHISAPLRRYLIANEAKLRRMAAEEAERGEFTLGLSRCIEILDAE